MAIPSRSLRSASNGPLLIVPFSGTATVARSFASFAPRVWNDLPRHVRDCFSTTSSLPSTSIDTFKRLLKTTRFASAFGSD